MAFYPEKILDTIALCEGYDGIGLGLSLVEPTYRNICGVEREIFPVANMVKKNQKIFMDEKPQWSDVSTFRIPRLRGLVDCITAGIPCQPFSCAGKQRGVDDVRWIWPSIYRIIGEIRPRILFFEEVSGFKKHGLPILLRDIAKIGYDATWDCFRAPDVEAPHKKRERIFILARLADGNGQRQQQSQGIDSEFGRRSIDRSKELAHPDDKGLQRCWQYDECSRKLLIRSPGCENRIWPARDGESQYGWEPPRTVNVKDKQSGNKDWLLPSEPSLGRNAYGYTSRVDELRLCGNGVLPTMAGLAWYVLKTVLVENGIW